MPYDDSVVLTETNIVGYLKDLEEQIGQLITWNAAKKGDPNAMVSTLTFLPFVLTGSVGVLTSLDFLGFGLPPGSPSLGELLNQGKRNLQAPWLGFAAFFALATMLSLLVFIGEAVRDAFDPRKTHGVEGA